jgi:hypothetical protein
MTLLQCLLPQQNTIDWVVLAIRSYGLMVFETGSPRSGLQQGRVLVRASSLACDDHLFTFSLFPYTQEKLKVL